MLLVKLGVRQRVPNAHHIFRAFALQSGCLRISSKRKSINTLVLALKTFDFG